MSKTRWEENLVAKLAPLADPKNPQRDVLAHLRRGLAAPDYALIRTGWLFANLGKKLTDYELSAALLVAGLFAWVKGNCPHSPDKDLNFGRAFGGTADYVEKRRKRFIDLLDADSDDLPFKLRQAITLINGAPLNWALLLKHVQKWDHPDRWVQKTWAQGFWSHSQAAEEDEPNAEAAAGATLVVEL